MKTLFLLLTLFVLSLFGEQRYGAIEIGGKGVKAYSIEIEGESARILSRKSVNIAPQSGIDANQHLSIEMSETISDAIQTLLSTSDAQPERIFIVASSALNKISNKDELRTAIFEKTHYPLHFIDEYEESLYGFYGSVPAKIWQNALLIDIGGGNTKFGWLDEHQQFHFAEIPLGTVSLTTHALKNTSALSYREKCLHTIDPYLSSLKNIPHKENIYTIGGIFWATASFKEGGQIEHDERLTHDDFSRISDTYENFSTPCHESSTQKECVILHYYGAQNLTAGAILASEMLKPFDLNSTTTFVKDGSWMVGWLLKFTTNKQ